MNKRKVDISKKSQKKISIVILMHNSAAAAESVVKDYYTEIIAKLPGSEFIIAEDGSTDGTKEILSRMAKKYPIRLLQAKEKKGYFKALSDAVKAAKNEYLFLSDGDGEHDPKDFWKLYDKIDGKDIVVGYKTKRKPFYRVIISTGNVMLDGLLFGLWLRGANCNFRLMKKKVMLDVVDEIGALKYTPSVEALIRAKRKGYTITEVPIRHIFVPSGELAPSKIPKMMLKELGNLIRFRIYGDKGRNMGSTSKGRRGKTASKNKRGGRK